MLYSVIMADGVDLTLIGAETLIGGYASFRLLDVAHSYDDLNLTDARLIGVVRGEKAGDNRFEIGAIDLYANADTGDLDGSYLPCGFDFIIVISAFVAYTMRKG